MAFRIAYLQLAFQVPGEGGFRAYGYSTREDTDAEVFSPGYFRTAKGLLQLGDLVYVRYRPRLDAGSQGLAGEDRLVLGVVDGFVHGDATLRMVQDFGCLGGPEAGEHRDRKGKAQLRRAPC